MIYFLCKTDIISFIKDSASDLISNCLDASEIEEMWLSIRHMSVNVDWFIGSTDLKQGYYLNIWILNAGI